MASSSRAVDRNDPRLSSKRNRSAMSRGDDKVVEIDTLRAFTIPKMKKAKHGALHFFSPVVYTPCSSNYMHIMLSPEWSKKSANLNV